jgi:hypothetical protein
MSLDELSDRLACGVWAHSGEPVILCVKANRARAERWYLKKTLRGQLHSQTITRTSLICTGWLD